MVSLQSAEEGEEASVRGRLGQKLLDLTIKLKRIYAGHFHYLGWQHNQNEIQLEL